MDTLSFLIENSNKVKIDEKLVKEYERENELFVFGKSKKPADRGQANRQNKIPSPSPGTRHRPLKAHPRLSPNNNPCQFPTSPRLTIRPSFKSPLLDLNHQTQESQLLSQLASRIETLKELQFSSQQKYSESLQQLQQEMANCNQEHEQQRQEFDRIRTEISSTKKDLAALIHMIQRKSQTEDEQQLRSAEKEGLRVKSPGTPRSVLSNFIKVVPVVRQ